MDIIKEIEQEYRNHRNFGVQFSIDADAYDCRLCGRVRFGENMKVQQCGSFINYQNILLDGEFIGWLEEIDCGRLFHPIMTSFVVPIKDSDDEELWEEYEGNPHFYEHGDGQEMRFATINQMLDYLNL